MNCPRCPATVLDERERDGIQVDVCPKCRGVWLDRGELERLVAAATRAVDAEFTARAVSAAAPNQAPPPPAPPARHRDDPVVRRRDDDDDDDDYDDRFARDDGRRHGDRGAPPRRKRWFEVFDIFD